MNVSRGETFQMKRVSQHRVQSSRLIHRSGRTADKASTGVGSSPGGEVFTAEGDLVVSVVQEGLIRTVP
jgi:hypothetical protein